jgi:hypothetical protein
MKTYPVGTKLVKVDIEELYSHFDVMVAAGKNDEEKMEGFEIAYKARRYVEDPHNLQFIEVEEDGEKRWGLSLPYAFVYPPAVAQVPSLGSGFEIEDGRSLWSFVKSHGIEKIVVAITPHTTESEALMEASRGNRPEGGIRRSQQGKQDIRKTVHRAFHTLKMSRTEINKLYGPIYTGQKTLFNKVLAEVWSEDNRQQLLAGAIQVAAGEGSVEEIAKLRGVTVKALAKCIEDKNRLRTKREAFSKNLGRSVDAPTSRAIVNLENLKPRVERKIESYTVEYQDVQDGLLLYQKKVEKLLEAVKELQASLNNDYGKTYSATAGR